MWNTIKINNLIKMSNGSIQVAIRVRPLIEREINSGYKSIVKKINEHQISIAGSKNCLFAFDQVFGETDNQETVYKNAVHHLIKQFFEGSNVTIFVYGQTGSGKTYTLDTNYNGIPSEFMGIIPRAVLDIFENFEKTQVNNNITVSCSFIEIYNEQIFDLLSDAIDRIDSIVDICEDEAEEVTIPIIYTEIEVNSVEEIIRCLAKGSSIRGVASRRSHTIFTIIIGATTKNNPEFKKRSFHFVDLVGSECSTKTIMTESCIKTGIRINQGLFALAKCFAVLSDSNSISFVPYRESKLTRFLQNSLGKNGVTLLITCVSPADSNMEETLNTFNYANRYNNFKNKPIKEKNAEQGFKILEAEWNDLQLPELKTGGIKQEKWKNAYFNTKMKFNNILSQGRSDKQRFNLLRSFILKTRFDVEYIDLKIKAKRLIKRKQHQNIMDFIKSLIKAILVDAEMEANFEHIKQKRDNLRWVVQSLKQEEPFKFEFTSEAKIELNKLNKQIATCQKTIIAKQDYKFNKLIDAVQSIEDGLEIVKCLFEVILFLNKAITEHGNELCLISKSNHALLKKVNLLEIEKETNITKMLADADFIEHRYKEKIEQLREMQYVEHTDPCNTTNRDYISEEIRKHKIKYLEIKYELEHQNEKLAKELKLLQEKGTQNDVTDENDEGDIEMDMFGDIIDHEIKNIIITRSRSQNPPYFMKTYTKAIKQLIHCQCNKSCSNKRCKCRKHDLKCNDKCKCNSLCSNAKGDFSNSYSNTDDIRIPDSGTTTDEMTSFNVTQNKRVYQAVEHADIKICNHNDTSSIY